jgi:hypothetical protein
VIKPSYYCVLKHYKGLFKKRFLNNTHLFILPRTETDYLYLALLGERTEAPDTYACAYITRIPDELLNIIIEGEKEYFKERFEIVEETPAEVSTIEKSKYLIRLKGTSGVFLSKKIILTYQKEESTPKQRIYNLVSKLNLEMDEITQSSWEKIIDGVMAIAAPTNHRRVPSAFETHSR